jgi:nitrate reductase gamma subunit
MTLFTITQWIASASLLFSIAAFSGMWWRMQRRASGVDRSVPKDSVARGIRYAFTTGMASWAKESTRLHMIGYLRGVVFHLGIFVGLAVLLLSPWLDSISDSVRWGAAVLAFVGAVMGIIGAIQRITERNLRILSTPDDHLSVWLVSIVLLSASVAVVSSEWLPAFYVASSVLLVYAPASKIRHCIFVYFGRLFYGIHIGRRGIVRGLEEHHA